MGDSYRPPPPRDRGGGGYNDNNGYTFRGAADTYRPPQHRPQERFSFNPPSGPAAPHFPAQQPPPRAQRPNRFGANKNRDRGRGGRQQGGAPYRRIPKPAHARELLSRKDRETTPEQLVGMNTDGQHRYVEKTSDSEDEDDTSDSDDTSEEDGEHGQARKRVKVDDEAEPARPKWSNPDPYSVLPPTDLGLQPKKDIVQTIRKAKVDASSHSDATNAIKENVDFISFDFGDEVDKDEDMDKEDGAASASGKPWKPTDREVAEKLTGSKKDGKKRKRVEEQSDRCGDIVDEWVADPNSTTSLPWHKTDENFTSSTGLQLHLEIIDFYQYVRPLQYEEDVRRDIIDRIEYAVRDWDRAYQHDVRIKSFGSFASGLYLPTADMDLVAVSRSYMDGGPPAFCRSGGDMHRLSRYLVDQGIAKSGTVTVVTRAKVPIIKFIDDRTSIKVDISFENDSGLRAIDTFLRWKEQYPEMPFLVVIIKQFLAMRGLNEVFGGGLGGFTIICLVVSMLQLMPANQRQSEDMASQYGMLLRDFFDLYGNKFNLEHTGIKMNPPGLFNKKDRRAIQAKINVMGLTIIDPNRPDNDISGGSRRVRDVFQYFREALHAIQEQMTKIRLGKAETSSILGCILAGNYTSFEEQRDILDRVHRTYSTINRPSPPPRPNPTMYPAAPPTQHGWVTYAQQVPPPSREGHYYALSNAHGYQQPPVPYHPPQAQQHLPLPARPLQLAPGLQPGHVLPPKQSKKAKKNKKGKNLLNSTHEEPTKKSKAQKKKERRERKKLGNATLGDSQAPQVKKKKDKKKKPDTETERKAMAKEERDKRAKKRHDTL
ncbi:hypothetical protein M409DRAFT_53836 [Zasmidium cellare ATCC 36951]|uniref:polynucleotide adenylyltransferase n=1 Tax=Zasmidium cellare ATCC 36951 TaxID=1080233 RepID=A0A6A6CQY1_ZASCE|nr:uncharacterized protein M409DRAFT_53836 [Zasmidium cellare ATCC 36951]KAF2167886.1 hypothetical protein M409DRAFT_53836 [Zasmidium cellare ATCC 36951]